MELTDGRIIEHSRSLVFDAEVSQRDIRGQAVTSSREWRDIPVRVWVQIGHNR
jgi:hypothetical protein